MLWIEISNFMFLTMNKNILHSALSSCRVIYNEDLRMVFNPFATDGTQKYSFEKLIFIWEGLTMSDETMRR